MRLRDGQLFSAELGGEVESELSTAHRTPVSPVSPEGRLDYGGGGRGGLGALEQGLKRTGSRDHYGPAVDPWTNDFNLLQENSGLDLQPVKSRSARSRPPAPNARVPLLHALHGM